MKEIKKIEPGLYRLNSPVDNPNADRRVKYQWDLGEFFEKGYYRVRDNRIFLEKSREQIVEATLRGNPEMAIAEAEEAFEKNLDASVTLNVSFDGRPRRMTEPDPNYGTPKRIDAWNALVTALERVEVKTFREFVVDRDLEFDRDLGFDLFDALIEKGALSLTDVASTYEQLEEEYEG